MKMRYRLSSIYIAFLCTALQTCFAQDRPSFDKNQIQPNVRCSWMLHATHTTNPVNFYPCPKIANSDAWRWVKTTESHLSQTVLSLGSQIILKYDETFWGLCSLKTAINPYSEQEQSLFPEISIGIVSNLSLLNPVQLFPFFLANWMYVHEISRKAPPFSPSSLEGGFRIEARLGPCKAKIFLSVAHDLTNLHGTSGNRMHFMPQICWHSGDQSFIGLNWDASLCPNHSVQQTYNSAQTVSELFLGWKLASNSALRVSFLKDGKRNGIHMASITMILIR